MKEIQLSQGKVALVDDEDFEYLNKFRWFSQKTCSGWYAIRHRYKNGKGITIYMHREILNPPPGKWTDHIDHNGLNNQRDNLRVVSRHENQCNRIKQKSGLSKYKGVTWNKRKKEWVSRVLIFGERKHLGYFNSEIEAAKAYDKIVKQYFGEFACTNEMLGLL